MSLPAPGEFGALSASDDTPAADTSGGILNVLILV